LIISPCFSIFGVFSARSTLTDKNFTRTTYSHYRKLANFINYKVIYVSICVINKIFRYFCLFF
jgi:hypothetical protein